MSQRPHHLLAPSPVRISRDLPRTPGRSRSCSRLGGELDSEAPSYTSPPPVPSVQPVRPPPRLRPKRLPGIWVKLNPWASVAGFRLNWAAKTRGDDSGVHDGLLPE